MHELLHKAFTILSYFFLILGIIGMLVFFGFYFKNDEVNLYFYFAITAFILGVILFTIYRRIAYLGMNKIIFSLNSVHQQVEELNDKFQQRHSQKEPDTSED
ncbi:MAG: hypothetical protein K8R90_03065 [Candidatus Cloacimonetes bacterium]|nr:hypothetical protein [Candidatus Cloacimonadota bacterium]